MLLSTTTIATRVKIILVSKKSFELVGKRFSSRRRLLHVSSNPSSLLLLSASKQSGHLVNRNCSNQRSPTTEAALNQQRRLNTGSSNNTITTATAISSSFLTLRNFMLSTYNKVAGKTNMRRLKLNSVATQSQSSSSEDSDTDIQSPLPRSLEDSVIGSPRYQLARPFVVSVEGNIGSGKSTLMKYFAETDSVETVPEPIEKWTNLNGHNALSKLYQNASRWSFSFNTYAALTRCQMHETATDKPVVLLERSLYSTRYCFVENDFQFGTLHDMEYHVLDKWFSYLLTHERLPIDLFVYLRADPVKCHERLKARNRAEETGVPLELIQRLHDYHESWLMEKKFPVPAPVLVLDANSDMTEMKKVYDQYRSKILFGHT